MSINSGKIWPYAIGLSIVAVFFLGIWTIVIAAKLPVQESDIYMDNYQSVDANMNDIIKARIKFDKKYNIKYISNMLKTDGAVVSYSLSDKNSNKINNAKIDLIITRPNTHDNDMKLENPSVKDGIYTFKSTKLPKIGRWNLMAKVVIGDDYRYYNLKADTRAKDAYEY